MSGKRNILSATDYLALGASLVLAFAVWLIHNLSLEYSALVQRSLVVTCEIDGHSNESASYSDIAASCQLSGFELLGTRISGRRHPVKLQVARDDMHHKSGDTYYMTASDATKYFHYIFSDKAKLEYFVTDTVFFTFNSVQYKKAPLRASASLSFAPQHMAVGGIKFVPDSVLVYGEKSVIDAVSSISTESLKLHNLDSDVYGKAKLVPIKGVRLSTKSADYSVNVVRYVQRELDLEVRALNVPDGVNLKVFPFTARLRYRMRFPADLPMDGAYVAIEYADFVRSISGKCLGEIVGLPADVLSYELEPEVFECLVQSASL